MIKNSKKKISNFWLFVIEFIFSLVITVITFTNILNILVLKNTNIFGLIINIVLIIIFVIYFIYLYKISKEKNENLFLLLAIPLILLFCIFVLPYHVADEQAHINKAYDVSNGNLISKKNEERNLIVNLPVDLIKYQQDDVNSYQNFINMINHKTNWNDKQITNEVPVAKYSFIVYLMPAIGIKIAEIFNFNFLIAIYIGRILNSILYLLFGYFIIKKIPFGKLLFLVYLLNPMFLHQSASISADVILNTASLLFISYVLFLKKSYEKLNIRNIIILLILLFLVGITKYLYIILVLLLLILIPNWKKSEKKEKLILIFGIIAILILILLELIHNMSYISINGSIIDGYNIDTIGQIKYLLNNPLSFIHTFFSTIKTYLYYFMTDFVGRRMGWWEIYTNMYLIILYYILLIHTIFFEKVKTGLKRIDKILLFILPFIIYTIISLSFYLLWTPVGGIEIFGIQARYFIPFIILLFIPLLDNKQKIIMPKYKVFYTIGLIIINLCAILYVIKYFL